MKKYFWQDLLGVFEITFILKDPVDTDKFDTRYRQVLISDSDKLRY